MGPGQAADADPERKRRGDFPTPLWLVDLVVEHVVPPASPGATVTVLDPACGDGRFLVAAGRALRAAGARPVLHGVEIDPAHAAAARRALALVAGPDGPPGAYRVDVGDALERDWGAERYDVVVGNPPYLSPLAASTSRRGAGRRGGGPYADVAAEFLHLAVTLARPAGGRIGLVLPQSILASRDVAAIRRAVDAAAERFWSWWSPAKHFAADVLVCALGFERRPATPEVHDEGSANPAAPPDDRNLAWTDVVLSALGIPPLPPLAVAGSVGDRARLTADFRDCYYGLVPAVDDGGEGPRLVTSGLIDPLRLRWGERPVRFARRRFAAPRVTLDALDGRRRSWAAAMRVPKVLVANQSELVECVVDPDGSTLPGVPVVTARPPEREDPSGRVGPDWAWAVAAVLTSPVTSAWVWHQAAGTGLAARSVRLGPRLLAAAPWPAGPLGEAVEAARAGDVEGCGRAVDAAFGLTGAAAAELFDWWSDRLGPHR